MEEFSMGGAHVFCGQVTVELDRGPDVRDVSEDLSRLITESGVVSGTICATLIGSTGSLTTIEYEPGVVEDLKRAMDRLAPRDAVYEHELAWHDGNGHSHVQAALMGPSISLPVRQGRLELGTWQQVVVINHDDRARRRVVEVTLVGTVS